MKKFLFFGLIWLISSCTGVNETQRRNNEHKTEPAQIVNENTPPEPVVPISVNKYAVIYIEGSINFTELKSYTVPGKKTAIDIGDQKYEFDAINSTKMIEEVVSEKKVIWKIIPYLDDEDIYRNMDFLESQIPDMIQRRYIKPNLTWTKSKRDFKIFDSYVEASQYADSNF